MSQFEKKNDFRGTFSSTSPLYILMKLTSKNKIRLDKWHITFIKGVEKWYITKKYCNLYNLENGEEKSYHSNGRLHIHLQEDGTLKHWDDEGNLKYHYCRKKGSMIEGGEIVVKK